MVTLPAAPVADAPGLEQLMLAAGASVHYGVPVCEIGEEGDYLLAPGHVDPRRMAGACNAYARENTYVSLWGRGGTPTPYRDALDRIHHRMAVITFPCPGGACDEDCDDCHGAEWGVSWAADRSGVDVPITILEWA